MHDPIYRRLFAFPRMVGDLLRVVGHPDWIGDVDLATLQKLPAEYVGDGGQQRRGDAVWRVRFRSRWMYLLVLLEFQSSNDARMALRNLEYTTLLYRELDRRDELGPAGRWPPVLPVVLYNGETPWTAALEMRGLLAPVPDLLAPYQPSQRSLLLDERHTSVDDLPLGSLIRAVVGLEQGRTPSDLFRVARAATEWLRTPEDTDLSRAFAEWIRVLVARMVPGNSLPELGETLEDVTMTLAERVAQWPEQWRREGIAEGRREGAAEGRREGVAEGRREGVAQERVLLCRQATTRFGEAVGKQLGALLDNIHDWDRLAAVGQLIVTAQSSPELLDGAAKLLQPFD